MATLAHGLRICRGRTVAKKCFAKHGGGGICLMGMNPALFTTIVITGFTVAFLHAAISTHWLPFVLTARVQKWNRSKTLFVTALAGSGHVLFTAVLGFLVAWFGIALNVVALVGTVNATLRSADCCSGGACCLLKLNCAQSNRA